jgi:predicted phage gp36 major capsid-like protein
MAGIAAAMVEQLGEQAGGLARGQRLLGESTDQAKPGDGENLKERQEQLNDLIEDLLEDIDQTARSMGGFNENATEDLLKEARESREDGIERSGKAG